MAFQELFFAFGLYYTIIEICKTEKYIENFELNHYFLQEKSECDDEYRIYQPFVIGIKKCNALHVSHIMIKNLLLYFDKINVLYESSDEITLNIAKNSGYIINYKGVKKTMERKLITDREWDIIDLFHQCITEIEISELLGISLKTVFSHKYNIMKKLGFRKSRDLYMWIGELSDWKTSKCGENSG